MRRPGSYRIFTDEEILTVAGQRRDYTGLRSHIYRSLTRGLASSEKIACGESYLRDLRPIP